MATKWDYAELMRSGDKVTLFETGSLNGSLQHGGHIENLKKLGGWGWEAYAVDVDRESDEMRYFLKKPVA